MELLDFVADLNDNPDAYMSETTEIIKKADDMLSNPFSFYGFSIQLQIEDQIDVANRAYIRYYKKKIDEILTEKEVIQSELENARRELNGFKKDQDKTKKYIEELQIKEKIVQAERVTLKKESDRTVQRISKEYVELYKKLAKQFDLYKAFVIMEFESQDNIKEGLEKIIKQKEDEIDELKEALSVPRQHYKYIDNL